MYTSLVEDNEALNRQVGKLEARVAELEGALRIAALRFDYLNAGGIEELNGVSTVAGAEECRAALGEKDNGNV